MFTGSLRESQQSEITLENIDVDALEALIPYCYTGSIDLREDTVENILSAACLLQLTAVVSACCNFLQKQLHPSNCLGIAMFAEQQSCTALQIQASEFTKQNYMEVYKNQEFLRLDAEQLGLLLKSDDLNVSSEESVFESVMTWVMYDRPNREKSLRGLLESVKLPLLSPPFLFDQVEVSCCSVVECQPLIMEALKWHLLPERRQQLSSERTNPRKSTICKMLAVGGMDANKGTTSIEMYDPCTNSWSQYMKMGVRRSQFGVVIIKDKLILIGGRDGLRTLNIVDCIDLKTFASVTLPPLQTQRHGLGVAVMGDGPNAPVYAVGGHDGWTYINTVERWDPVSRSWSYVAPMSSQRSTCGVGVLQGKLYAVGGRDGSACLRTVEAYCPHTNKWKQCPSMIKKRGGVGVAVLGGYLYALGGHDAPAKNGVTTMFSCMERYDPIENAWTLIANLSRGRDGIGICILGDKLVAVGGYDGNEYLKDVEQYDTKTREWHPLAHLNIGRAGACIVPMPLNIRKRKVPE